jgi:GxxExxY protein
MLEGAYQACLEWELRQMGLGVDRQIPVDVIYRGHRMETGFRADLLVQDDEGRRVIVELKAVAQMVPIFRAQVITYLRLLDLPLGLLVNFNTVLLKDGISRILNKNWVPPLAGSGIHNHGATDAT